MLDLQHLEEREYSLRTYSSLEVLGSKNVNSIIKIDFTLVHIDVRPVCCFFFEKKMFIIYPVLSLLVLSLSKKIGFNHGNLLPIF